MFTVEPIATDDGVYKVTRSDGIRLYIHRKQQLVGPYVCLSKILHIGNNSTDHGRIKALTDSKPYSTNIPKITLYPIEPYIKYIQQCSKKSQHEKAHCVNSINEYFQAIDDFVIRTESNRYTVSTDGLKRSSFELQIVNVKGEYIYRVRVLGIDTPVIFNRTNGFIGSKKFILKFIGINNSKLKSYGHITRSTNTFPSEIATVRFGISTILIMSMRVIDHIIEQLITPDNQEAIKLKVRMLHEELSQICTENATVSPEPVNDSVSAITDDKSISECDTMRELIYLIEGNMEEPTVNEFNRIVASIADNILFNQTVAISKNDDDTLNVIMKDISSENLDEDYIFSNKYLIRAVEVYRLLDKLHDKGIISNINGDTLTVDDTEFFIDALSYKLMKISERNRESNIDSISVES